MSPRTQRDIFRDARRRALQAHAMRVDGLTYAAIGTELGIGPSYARDLAMKGSRVIERRFQHVAEALEELQARLAAKEFTPSSPGGERG